MLQKNQKLNNNNKQTINKTGRMHKNLVDITI